MKENINALNEIHKGSCMGMDAIIFILDKVSDKALKKELEHEYIEYKKIAEEIEEIYPKYNGGEPQETSGMTKTMTWTGIEMKTFNDKSSSKIAEILLNGVNMGIIEGRRVLNNKKISKELNTIISKYVTMQEQNMENLKQYL